MTRDDLRLAAIRVLAEAMDGLSEFAILPDDADAILDALTPEAKSTLARYLLGDAIDAASLPLRELAVIVEDAVQDTWPSGDAAVLYERSRHIAERIAARLAESKP